MQNIRNIADYETISISKRKAEKQLAMAQEFITIIAKEIQQ